LAGSGSAAGQSLAHLLRGAQLVAASWHGRRGIPDTDRPPSPTATASTSGSGRPTLLGHGVDVVAEGGQTAKRVGGQIDEGDAIGVTEMFLDVPDGRSTDRYRRQ
jgi:hypothetical protein